MANYYEQYAQEGTSFAGFTQSGRLIESRMVFDGKRMRKPIVRKPVDYNHSMIRDWLDKVYARSRNEPEPFIPPHPAWSNRIPPPDSWLSNPSTSITTRFAHASTNKVKSAINVVCWTPEGRRLITGSVSGEFTLWNGMAFNFETIQQAHDSAVRAMVWTHNDQFMATADHNGIIKYWQSNMNNLKAFQGHQESIRDLSFCPTDIKFASCSDDGTIKIWNFETCKYEKVLTGHGSDVRCIDWHPTNSLIASGAKDYLVKLWDAKSGINVATLYGHKNTIFKAKWNLNGNWLLTGSRDQLIKLFDIRFMKDFYTFRGHKKEVTSLAWHPFHEKLFVSGGYDGSIMFWIVGNKDPQGKIPQAHDSTVWDLAWHPIGHVLCSGSNDNTTKFWARNKPGDKMRDKYNLSQLPEDVILEEQANQAKTEKKTTTMEGDGKIPGVIPGIFGSNVPQERPIQPQIPNYQSRPILSGGYYRDEEMEDIFNDDQKTNYQQKMPNYQQYYQQSQEMQQNYNYQRR